MSRARERHTLFKLIAAYVLKYEKHIGLFGGCPRDWKRHTSGAKSFYKSNSLRDQYSNPDVHPKSATNRLVVPRDVDMVHWDTCKPNEKVDRISRLIQRWIPHVKEVKRRDMGEYIDSIHGVNTFVIRLIFLYAFGNIFKPQYMSFHLDIVQIDGSHMLLPFFLQIPFTTDVLFVTPSIELIEQNTLCPIDPKLDVDTLFRIWETDTNAIHLTRHLSWIRPTTKSVDATMLATASWNKKLLRRILSKMNDSWIIPNAPFRIKNCRENVDWTKKHVLFQDGTTQEIYEFLNRLSDMDLQQGVFKSPKGNVYTIQPGGIPNTNMTEATLTKAMAYLEYIESVLKKPKSAIVT